MLHCGIDRHYADRRIRKTCFCGPIRVHKCKCFRREWFIFSTLTEGCTFEQLYALRFVNRCTRRPAWVGHVQYECLIIDLDKGLCFMTLAAWPVAYWYVSPIPALAAGVQYSRTPLCYCLRLTFFYGGEDDKMKTFYFVNMCCLLIFEFPF